MLPSKCPLWVKNGHWLTLRAVSALCQERTLGPTLSPRSRGSLRRAAIVGRRTVPARP